jgi:ABC-2 type transport system permease protein
VTIILAILGLPFIMLGAFSDLNYSDSSLIAMFVAIGITCFIGSLVTGFIFPRTAFDFLTSRSRVDTRMALPLNQRQQFFSNYFAAVTLYIVPYIIGALISLLIWATLVTGQLGGDTDYPTTGILALAELGLMMVLIMFITIQIFALTFTGSQFEEKVFSLVSLGIVPAVMLIYAVCVFDNGTVYGVPFTEIYYLVFTSNPIGGGVYSLFYVFRDVMMSGFWNWFIGFFVWLLIYLGLAYFFFMKRKAEQVGTPIVFMSVYNAIIFSLLFVSFLPLVSDSFSDVDGGMAIFFVTVIIYSIIEVIRNRGFNNVFKSIVRYGVCSVLALVIATVSVNTNGFGIDKYVPSTLSVSSVTVGVNGVFNEFPDVNYDGVDIYETYGSPMYKEKENVQYIVDLHKKLVAERPFSGKYDPYNMDSIDDDAYANVEFDHINMVYKLKSGVVVSRSYMVPREDILSLVPLVHSDEYAAMLKKAIREGFGLDDPYVRQNPEEFSKLRISSKLNLQIKTVSGMNMDEFSGKFLDAYIKDLKDMTDEEYLSTGLYCKLYLYYGDQVPILNCFTNSIALLEEYDCQPYSTQHELGLSGEFGDEGIYKNEMFYDDEENPGYYDDQGFFIQYEDKSLMKLYAFNANADAPEFVPNYKETTYYSDLTAHIQADKWADYLENAKTNVVLTTQEQLVNSYLIYFHGRKFVIDKDFVKDSDLVVGNDD